MREILFRAKRLDNGEWVEARSIARSENEDGSEIWFIGAGQPGLLLYNEQGNLVAIETMGDCLFYACDPETIGQFTGLTDKNGNKIFEGDILSVLVNEMAYPEAGTFEENVFGRRKMPTGNKVRTVWSVEYKCRSSTGNSFYVFGKDRRFSHILTGNTVYNAQAEVIGNIYENPELLEG